MNGTYGRMGGLGAVGFVTGSPGILPARNMLPQAEPQVPMPSYGFVTGSPGILPARNMLGSLGAGESTEEASSSGGMWALLDTYAPSVTALVNKFTDPHRQAAVLQAELDAAIARGASDRKIATIKAKLDAALREAMIREQEEQHIKDSRNLTNLLIVSGIAVGGSLALYIMVSAVKQAKKR